MAMPLLDNNNPLSLEQLDFAQQCKIITDWRQHFIDAKALFSLEKNHSESELKKSYRHLAMHFHPDKNPDFKELAQSAFNLINDANIYLNFRLQDSQTRSLDQSSILNNPFYKEETPIFSNMGGFGSMFGQGFQPFDSGGGFKFRPKDENDVSQMDMGSLMVYFRKLKRAYATSGNKQPFKIPGDIKARAKQLYELNQIPDGHDATFTWLSSLFDKSDIPFVEWVLVNVSSEFVLNKIGLFVDEGTHIRYCIKYQIEFNADIECVNFILSKYGKGFVNMNPWNNIQTLPQNAIQVDRLDILKSLMQYCPEYFEPLININHFDAEGLLATTITYDGIELFETDIISVPMINYLYEQGFLTPARAALYDALSHGRLTIAYALLDKNIDFDLEIALRCLVMLMRCNTNAAESQEFILNKTVVLPVGYAQTQAGCKQAVSALMKRIINTFELTNSELDKLLHAQWLDFIKRNVNQKNNDGDVSLFRTNIGFFDAGMSSLMQITQERMSDKELKKQCFSSLWNADCQVDFFAYQELLYHMPNLINDMGQSRPLVFKVLNSLISNNNHHDYNSYAYWHRTSLINYLLNLDGIHLTVTTDNVTRCDELKYKGHSNWFQKQQALNLSPLQLCCLHRFDDLAFKIIDKIKDDLQALDNVSQIQQLIYNSEGASPSGLLPHHKVSALHIALFHGMDGVAAKLISLGCNYKTPALIQHSAYRFWGYFAYSYSREHDVLETAKFLKMPKTVRALHKRLLIDYINEREKGINHLTRIGFGSYTLFGFGFHKNDKLNAARALLDMIELDKDNYAGLINNTQALQQGRLAKIASLGILCVNWEKYQENNEHVGEHYSLYNHI